MLHSHQVSSQTAGPRLLVLGAVHGNEKCGTFAIARILKEFGNKSLTFNQGLATFIPVCNPKAYDRNERFIDRNLNRKLIPTNNPESYEAKLTNELCPLLAECDFLLDLHSYTAGGAPFAFVSDKDEAELSFANSLGTAALMTGWQNAYATSSQVLPEVTKDEAIGTTDYARKFGAKAVTVECGQHADPESVDFAYLAIRRALAFLQMANPVDPFRQNATPIIDVKKVFFRGDGGRFTRAWQHLDGIEKGEVVAIDDKGRGLEAPDDGFVIMPHADTPAGTEWFYWGQLVG